MWQHILPRVMAQWEPGQLGVTYQDRAAFLRLSLISLLHYFLLKYTISEGERVGNTFSANSRLNLAKLKTPVSKWCIQRKFFLFKKKSFRKSITMVQS